MATRMVANLVERKVIMLAAKGSMAALASWNRAIQPAKIRSGRIPNRLSRPDTALLCSGLARPPCALVGSISWVRIWKRANSAGTVILATRIKAARFEM